MHVLDSEVSADYCTDPPGIVSLLMFTIGNIQTMVLHIHTQGRCNNHTEQCSDRIMVTETSIMGEMKMGNSVPRAGIEPTSLAFWASVLPLHHVGLDMSPI